jgi:hypothetical protein
LKRERLQAVFASVQQRAEITGAAPVVGSVPGGVGSAGKAARVRGGVAVAEVRLDRGQLVELAELVADALAARLAPHASGALVDAAAVAARYSVTRDFVYRNVSALGGVRLGDGPRARLRFDLEEAGRRLVSCSGIRESGVAAGRVVEPGSGRRRRGRSGTGVPLLPVRGGDRG